MNLKNNLKPRNIIISIGLLSLSTVSGFADNPAPNPAPAGNQSAETAALTRMLNNAFFSFDVMFPTPNYTNSNSINTLQNANQMAAQWTQNNVYQTLHGVPNAIAHAYNNLSPAHFMASDMDPDVTQNQITDLTVKLPSFDNLVLPDNVVCLPSDGGCAHRSNDTAGLQRNANNFSFDGFFAPAQSDPNTAQNYMRFLLKSYQPVVDNGSTGSDPTGGGSSKSFFQLLNDQLENDPKHANSFLMKSVINNPQFQQYWADLRSYSAKNSMILSHLNFLAAERAPQKGLGAAYNVKDANGNPINDASAMQVEQSLVNSTVYNPDWYKAMKTAPLATLQRQQLLLTSLLVRLQYHNEMINERNLSLQIMQAANNLQQEKMNLQQEETQLKTAIFPDAAQPTSVPGAGG